MNVLAAILPGIREVRSPLIVGSLWAGVLLLLVPRLSALMDVAQRVTAAHESLAVVPGGAWLALSLFACYVTGEIALTATLPLADSLGKIARKVALKYSGDWTNQWPPLGWKWSLWKWATYHPVDDTGAAASISDAINRALVASKAPVHISSCVPREPMLELTHHAHQLWQNHPARYEEYDRLRTEWELRRAICPPLALLGGLLLLPNLLFFVLLLGALAVLLRRARQIRELMYSLLASSLSIGLLEIPAIRILQDELSLRTDIESDAEWAVAALGAFCRRGFDEEAEAMRDKLVDLARSGWTTVEEIKSALHNEPDCGIDDADHFQQLYDGVMVGC